MEYIKQVNINQAIKKVYMEKTTFTLIKQLLFGRPSPLHEKEDVPAQAFFLRIVPLLFIIYYVYPVCIRELYTDLPAKLGEPEVFFLLLVMPNIFLPVALFGIIYFTARKISIRKKLGMINWRSGYLWSGVAICFILLIVNGLLGIMIDDMVDYLGLKVPSPAIFALLNKASILQKIWLLFLVLVLAPIFEELIFRRFIYNYCEATLGMLPAILITSAWFAVIHDAWIQWPELFILGVVFQLSYIVSRSIYFPVTIHFLNNLISVCIYFLWM
jgi:CAAX protease family protein